MRQCAGVSSLPTKSQKNQAYINRDIILRIDVGTVLEQQTRDCEMASRDGGVQSSAGILAVQSKCIFGPKQKTSSFDLIARLLPSSSSWSRSARPSRAIE